jgi:hypothetical protein
MQFQTLRIPLHSCRKVSDYAPFAPLRKEDAVARPKSQSIKKANSPRFSFGFINNHCDSSNHAAKLDSNRMVFEGSDFAESYTKSKLGAVLQLDSLFCDCKCYLIFFAIKEKSITNDQGLHSSDHFNVGEIDTNGRSGRNDDFMLRGITQLIDGKEQVIRSAVRLETSKQPRDLVGEILAANAYATFEVSSGFAEREMNFVYGRQIGELGDRNGRQIECGPEMLNCVDCALCKGAWERFAESEFVMFANTIKIRFNEKLVWCSLKVNLREPLKIGKFFLCPLEPLT